MRDFSIVEKHVGQTPLEALEFFRTEAGISKDTPLAYAGRLDPMASGKLLVLIGDECKQQEKYFGLDKEYIFEVLFGVSSDTGDVLGLLTQNNIIKGSNPLINDKRIQGVCKNLIGKIELPYPHFSSKTVQGKPLHVWTLEGRLDEIEIPTYSSEVFKLELLNFGTAPIDYLYELAIQKINSIPPVTDEGKALGNDFRRTDVRASWKAFHEARTRETYHIAQFRCICSSGMYMRTLAEEIAKAVGTSGLAFSIYRSEIGKYKKLPLLFGFWTKRYH